MTFHSEKTRAMKQRSILFLLILFFVNSLSAIPDKPYPPRLVNDLASVFTQSEVSQIEYMLQQFSLSTKTQIVVVTVNSLEGKDPNMFAFEIGEKWEVGDKEFDNGIVLLIKPKTLSSKGRTAIQVGYGLEPVIPDAIAKRIVENEMIPSFKREDFFEGTNRALDVLMKLSLKEFTAQEYKRKTSKEERTSSIIGLLVMIFIFMSIFGRTSRIGRSSMGRSNLSLWLLLSMLGSGRSHSGSFGDFSSGSGGFGGFGGGSFGGGGASGSW